MQAQNQENNAELGLVMLVLQAIDPTAVGHDDNTLLPISIGA